MQSSDPDAVVSTFVIRFVREWSSARPRWRRRIEHLQSGDSAALLELDEMLGILRSHGVRVVGQHRPP